MKSLGATTLETGLIQSASHIAEVSIALLDLYFVYQENLSKHAQPRNKTPLIRALGRDHNIDFGIKNSYFFFARKRCACRPNEEVKSL